jgi:hypothetical protein
MSIADGFSLWIGKILAEVFITVAVFAAVILALFAYAAVAIWREDRKAKRARASESGEPVRD